MKRILILLLAVLLLFGCSQPAETKQTSAPEPTATPEPTAEPTVEPTEEPNTVTIDGEVFLYDGFSVVEPEVTFDIYEKTVSDFVDDFDTVYEVDRESYLLTPGADTETTVVKIVGKEPGPVVYVAAGIHGNERAAWYAGLMLQNVTIKAGTLYVLAPANAQGARLNRRTVGDEDPNRCFPGDVNGTLAQRICYAIFHDIEEKQPEILLDLHEAIVYSAGRDFLGSNLIYSSLTGMEDLFFDLLFDTQDGKVTSRPFNVNGPGPAGSMNRTVAEELGIPAITVETFRGFPMERRVSDQLKIVAYVLRYKGML